MGKLLCEDIIAAQKLVQTNEVLEKEKEILRSEKLVDEHVVIGKKRPIEMSNTKPRLAPHVLKKRFEKNSKSIDPRFCSYAGQLNLDLFTKTYSFLEEHRIDEAKSLAENSKKSDKQSAAAKRQLEKLKSSFSHRRKLGKTMKMTRDIKRKEVDAVIKSGKKPYFIGKGKIKKLIRDH